MGLNPLEREFDENSNRTKSLLVSPFPKLNNGLHKTLHSVASGIGPSERLCIGARGNCA